MPTACTVKQCEPVLANLLVSRTQMSKTKKIARLWVWLLALVYGVMLTHAMPSHAGEMYVFKDKNGNVLLTNVVNNKKKPKGKQFSSYKTKVKVTWYKDTNVHTYKDWGRTEAAVLPSYSKNKRGFDHLIVRSARRHNIDPGLMKAIMHTESGFNPRARSPVGAQGLMQLMPPTAKQYGVRNAWDPAQNIEGSAKYLKYLKKLFKGNTRLMLAGYNAGQGNVLKYGGIPPFPETQNYVRKVLSRYHKLYKNTLGSRVASGNYTATSTPALRAASYSTNKAHATARLSTSRRANSDYALKPNSIQSGTKGWKNYSHTATGVTTQRKKPNSSYDASAFEALKRPLPR